MVRSNRRRNRQSRGQRASAVAVHRAPVVRYSPDVFGFPDRLLTRLRYFDTVGLTSTTGSLAHHVFRVNSTFDPDQTGTGHQPLYRDVYAGVYDFYAVVSARAIIQFVNPTTSSFFVSVTVEDDATPPTTATSLAEKSHGQSFLLTPLTGSKSTCEFIVPWSCAKYLNIDPFSSYAYKAAVGANPVELSYIAVSAATTDSSTATIAFSIKLEQEVLWSELSTQAEN